MATNIFASPLRRQLQLSFWIVTLAFVAGFTLSILSWLEICVKHCSATNNYRLFTFPFAFVGLTFFSTALITQVLSLKFSFLSRVVTWMIASALGAELFFIFVQKYQIGRWCPVCLSIALCVAIAAVGNAIHFFYSFTSTSNRGDIMMKIVKKSLASLSFFSLGLLMAFIGVAKIDPAQAALAEMKDRLTFGAKGSPVEVYFISDWFCPSCKKVEPIIEKIMPKIHNQVAFYFIDYPIHRKSMNFSPYNLSFLINDKGQYFKARQMLMDLAEETDSPNPSDVVKAAEKAQIPYKEIPYVDIKTGLEYFDKVTDKYNLSATPVIIVANIKTNKFKKLEGTEEIDEQSILKAIESVKGNG